MCAIHRFAVHNFNLLWDTRSSLHEYGCPVPACPDMDVIFLTFTLFHCFLRSHIILHGNFVPQTVGVLRPISAKILSNAPSPTKQGMVKKKRTRRQVLFFKLNLLKIQAVCKKRMFGKLKPQLPEAFKWRVFGSSAPLCGVGMKCWALENLLQQSWKQWNMWKRPWTGSYCNFNQFFEL